MYKVLITTSGTGSRLKELTRNTNKALIPLAGQPIIDSIIASYKPDVELVFTLGYCGDQVREYVSKKYPDRPISFLKVDPYEGEGSSLGYSMLQAKDLLQCPFIFHCNDTIVRGALPSPELSNWDAVSRGNDPQIFNAESYSSVLIKDGNISEMQMKGAARFDSFHIGLVGIKDFAVFWQALEYLYQENPKDTTLNDCAAIRVMLKKGCVFQPVSITEWYDTGNLVTLQNARERLKT